MIINYKNPILSYSQLMISISVDKQLLLFLDYTT